MPAGTSGHVWPYLCACRLIAHLAPDGVAANSFGGLVLLILIVLSGFSIVRSESHKASQGDRTHQSSSLCLLVFWSVCSSATASASATERVAECVLHLTRV